MTSVYRLLRKPFSATPFDGEGSFRFGGRWSRPGVRVVYTAERLSLAMLEYLAQVDAARPPTDLMLARADVPDDLDRVELKGDKLPEGWRAYPPPERLSDIGEAFVRERKAALLIVPSTIATTDDNWVLNPSHTDFLKILLHPAVPFNYAPRLLKQRVG